ncbi:zf-HC2 domain-containing protein [Dactylosporangium sp. CS-033363]|uniref:zf-HC2 domain-containing protein n=1 Tax=Dactylosporangium sp. CS-033363 TaxID=3239935 RepID=UPI003D94CA9B
MSWHVDQETFERYAAGRLDPVAAAALEQHVTACPPCRAGARPLVPDVGVLWAAVHAEIVRPRPPWPLRLLARLGVPESDLVVVAAARDLRLSWSVAVGAAVCCAFLAGLTPVPLPGGPAAVFLLLAPLIPVLAVIATYDATDPFREVAGTTPYSRLRLALLRTVAALVAAVPLTVAAALAVPALHGYFATWLLPGLALTVAALILLTWLTARVATAVVATGWLVLGSVAGGTGAIQALPTAAGQAGSALVTAVLAAALVHVTTTNHARGAAR